MKLLDEVSPAISRYKSSISVAFKQSVQFTSTTCKAFDTRDIVPSDVKLVKASPLNVKVSPVSRVSPPFSRVSPSTTSVEDAERLFEMCNGPETVEEA